MRCFPCYNFILFTTYCHIDSLTDDYPPTLEHDARMLFCLLDLTDSFIFGEFALAMMADEYTGLNWSFNSLKIIIPANSAEVIENFFRDSGYKWKITTNDVDDGPDASPQEVLSFVFSAPPFSGRMSAGQGHGIGGIELYIRSRNRMMRTVGKVQSTALASFIAPSGLFCAYPEMTFHNYAIAMNRFPTTASLYSHSTFRYKMHLTNEFWLQPCGRQCPSHNRSLSSSFAVISLREINGLMSILESHQWWRIQADCLNTECPHYGVYLT